MTGPNKFIDKNPGIEEIRFKKFSHEERKIIKSAADFDVIGDLPSEFRTGVWWFTDNNLQFKEKFKEQGILCHIWIQQCRFSTGTQIYVCVLGTGGFGVLCWGFIVYLGFQAFVFSRQTPDRPSILCSVYQLVVQPFFVSRSGNTQKQPHSKQLLSLHVL